MSDESLSSRVGDEGSGANRTSGTSGVLDTVRDVAASSGKPIHSRAVKRERHVERVRRVRSILKFIREYTNPEKHPNFDLAAKAAVKTTDLYPNNQRNISDIALSMKLLWNKRSYWESDEALDRLLSGGRL